jgi:hypothetical protein
MKLVYFFNLFLFGAQNIYICVYVCMYACKYVDTYNCICMYV